MAGFPPGTDLSRLKIEQIPEIARLTTDALLEAIRIKGYHFQNTPE